MVVVPFALAYYPIADATQRIRVIRDGLIYQKRIKIGDVDPRDDASVCFLVSDKARAVGGGVLEAILSREEMVKDD